jgi:hypothetical protein
MLVLCLQHGISHRISRQLLFASRSFSQRCIISYKSRLVADGGKDAFLIQHLYPPLFCPIRSTKHDLIRHGQPNVCRYCHFHYHLFRSQIVKILFLRFSFKQRVCAVFPQSRYIDALIPILYSKLTKRPSNTLTRYSPRQLKLSNLKLQLILPGNLLFRKRHLLSLNPSTPPSNIKHTPPILMTLPTPVLQLPM